MNNYFILSYSLRFSQSLACTPDSSMPMPYRSIRDARYAPNQKQHREKWINNDSPESSTFLKVYKFTPPVLHGVAQKARK